MYARTLGFATFLYKKTVLLLQWDQFKIMLRVSTIWTYNLGVQRKRPRWTLPKVWQKNTVPNITELTLQNTAIIVENRDTSTTQLSTRNIKGYWMRKRERLLIKMACKLKILQLNAGRAHTSHKVKTEKKKRLNNFRQERSGY